MGAQTAVVLITGFLGSGKTTFLNRMIRAVPPTKKLAILMNEFGEVGVDGALIVGDDLDILEINKGSIFCVCVKTDFIKGLHRLAETIRPDVLVIESTGVANPKDLRRDLGLPLFRNRFRFAAQVCLVDALNFVDAYDTFGSVEYQIESSSLFIINKTDLASPEQVQRVKDIIGRHQPDPTCFDTAYADIPLDVALPGLWDSPQPDEDPAGPSEPISPERLDALIDELLDDPDRELTPPDRLLSVVYAWRGEGLNDLERVMACLPAGVVRGKGILSLGRKTHLLSYVMGTWTVEPHTVPANRRQILDRLVFILPPEVLPRLEESMKRSAALIPVSVLDRS